MARNPRPSGDDGSGRFSPRPVPPRRDTTPRPDGERPGLGRRVPGLRGNGTSGGSGGPDGGDGKAWPSWLPWVAGLLLVAVLVLPRLASTSTPDTFDWATFLQRAAQGQVRTAQFTNGTGAVTGTLADGTSYRVSGPAELSPTDRAALDENVALEFRNPSSSIVGDLVATLLPFILIMGFWLWMSRRAQGQMGGIMQIGRSRGKVWSAEKPSTRFADVAGYEGVKTEISEVVDFLKAPQRFAEIGAKIPKGVLMVGPPGTGKTLFARAIAGEAGVPFVSVTGSDFMEMFVGVGASRVRDMFQTARRQSPCIIFIDEIDSIGRKRGAGLGGGHDEREQTLNQLLSEMDGFETSEGIVVLAATNRPDILDPALLRPGRFDRQVVIPLPELEERLPILQVHCRDKRLAPDVDLELIARGTPGMSGADLANLVNEAALHAVRRKADTIAARDFEAARDRVLMGQARESLVLKDDEKATTAYHEAGHAVLAHLLPQADPVHKVTIIPRGMALGVTMQMPEQERHSYSRDYLEDRICVSMGGRAAERIVYGHLTTGASNDLVTSTELARRMVREWGMSDRIGPMAWGSQGQVFLGEDLMHSRDYSDQTSHLIDTEVEEILRAQESRAMELLTSHRAGLDAVARTLLEQETIDGTVVSRLVDDPSATPSPDPQVGEPAGDQPV